MAISVTVAQHWDSRLAQQLVNNWEDLDGDTHSYQEPNAFVFSAHPGEWCGSPTVVQAGKTSPFSTHGLPVLAPVLWHWNSNAKSEEE